MKQTSEMHIYLSGKGSFDNDKKKCSSTEKLLVTDSTHAVSPVSDLQQPITTAPSACNAILEVETDPGLQEDEAVYVTDCNKRSLTTGPDSKPAITQYSILESSKVECVVVNANGSKGGIQSEIKHNVVSNPFVVDNRSVSEPETQGQSDLKLKCAADRRRYRRYHTNEAVVIRSEELGNNVCIGYRHPDAKSRTSGDVPTIRSGITGEAAEASVHSSGPYPVSNPFFSSSLQRAAAARPCPSLPVQEVVRVDIKAGKAGISSIQSTTKISASIAHTTPNSFAQSKHPSTSGSTLESTLNERNGATPDTQSVDVYAHVAKETWNNLPDSQIEPSSRWKAVNHHASSGKADYLQLLPDSRTSGSNSSVSCVGSTSGGGLAKPIENRPIPIQQITAGRRSRYRVKEEELYRRYSAPSTESTNTQRGRSKALVPGSTITSIAKPTTVSIPPPPSATPVSATSDKENNYTGPIELQPLLVKDSSLDYDTLNIVPAGDKSQTENMENIQNTWKRNRPPLPRGSSVSAVPLDTKIERRKYQTGRPRSAEFLLEDTDTDICNIPHGRLMRSPSDGDKTLLLALDNRRNYTEKADGKNTHNEKHQGFLRKMFTFTRRSRSRENKDINSKNRSRSLTSENSSKRSRSLTGSRSRSPSNRSRSPSNTSSMESSESYNNNTMPIMDNRIAAINSRRYFRMYNEIDENRNIDAPSPPIAVWSSDEDISSAPSTPRRKSHGSDHSSPRRVVFRKYSDNRDPNILKTISPELEEQISASLREPSKLKRDIADITPGEPEAIGVTRFRCSPRRHSSGHGLKKYAVNRHHSAEVPQTVVSQPIAPPLVIPSATSAATPVVTSAVTQAPIHTGPRYPPRGPLLQYTRMKNNTVDLSHVIINEPTEPNKTVNTSHQISNSETCNLNCPFPYQRSKSSLGCVPQSSTSTAAGLIYQSPPYRLNQKESHLMSDHSEYMARRGVITRTSWGRYSQLSPGDQEIPVTMGLVENISTDSGIQQDSYESSNESLKTGTDELSSMQVVRRIKSQQSPQKSLKERPKSDCLNVRWAKCASVDSAPPPSVMFRPSPKHRLKKSYKERPKSDLGTTNAISDALEQYELRESCDTVPGLPNVASRGLKRADSNRIGNRRMSQPHPIKLRTERSPPTVTKSSRQSKIWRSRSAPDLLPKAKKSRSVFQTISAHVGDIALPAVDYSSAEEEEGTDELTSLDTGSSETSSISSMGKQAILEEIFEEEATFVEALWDHVTMDREELGFRAGDVIEVKDVTDKDWWWGSLGCRSGWFPATFVRLRANQQVTAEDFVQKVKDGSIDSAAALRRYSVSLLSKEQARTNVIMEIINAEREYVKHLKDMVEGYLEKARKRPEMFPCDRLTTIFSNIEEIYHFSRAVLHDMERQFMREAPQVSELGCIFLKYRRGFEIYSEYCNNHPQAHEELRTLQKNKKYLHFFEACRLLQQMIEIPLEGFLLTPVQKICKYPLQLAELLKYTRCEHPDYEPLKAALSCMRDIAALINERKRKMESMEKLLAWQESVQDWEGPDLIDQSSELIHSAEVIKVNSSGWSQERIFFMFDHQIIYCKKDLLWRDIMVYKGRIDLDNCDIYPIEDGKDTQFGATVKNAIKINDLSKEKWHLFCAKTPEERDQWLTAFEEERMRIMQDIKSGFNLNEYRVKINSVGHRHGTHPEKHKDKNSKRKVGLPAPHHVEYLVKSMPIHATLPRASSSRHPNQKKKAWSLFTGKKTKS